MKKKLAVAWAGNLVGTHQGNVSTTSSGFSLGDGTSPMTPITTGVSVEDSDGRTITGTYTVNFHMPSENAEVYNSEQEAYQNYLTIVDHSVIVTTNPENQVATNGGGIAFTYSYGNPFWATVATDGVSHDALKYVSEADIPILSLICQQASVAMEVSNSVNGSDTADFDNLWGDGHHSLLEDAETSSWPAAALMPYYRMRPLRLVGHTLKYIKYDAYGEDGFDGPGRILTEILDGRLQTAGNYHYFTHPFPTDNYCTSN